MIYFNEDPDNCLDCLIECAYLDETLCYKNAEAIVYVCPDNPTYISREKVVVINKHNYNKSNILKLIKNGCKIISRVNLEDIDESSIIFSPYILRPNLLITWNGSYINYLDLDNSLSLGTNILGSGKFSTDSGILYFPKILNIPEELVKDSSGNLTSIGWANQQVGVNIITDTVFTDLDLFKTKKTLFKEA